jgi:hypothetical protein
VLGRFSFHPIAVLGLCAGDLHVGIQEFAFVIGITMLSFPEQKGRP